MVQFFLCLNITTDTPNIHSWHSVEIPSMRNPALCLVRYVQGKLHGQAIYSHVAVQIPDISLKNWRRRRRWWTRTLNWTVPDNWSCSLFSDESRFNLAYCGGRGMVWKTAEDRYIPECLRMVNRNRIVSVMVWGAIGYHGVGNLVILDENVNADKYVRTLS